MRVEFLFKIAFLNKKDLLIHTTLSDDFLFLNALPNTELQGKSRCSRKPLDGKLPQFVTDKC